VLGARRRVLLGYTPPPMRLGTQQVNAQGHLEIGGCDALMLAETFGTPLYVLDEDALRARCREYKAAFASLKPDVQIAYAAKAALNRALCQIIAEEGLGLDVASGGELYTALQAGFPSAHIHMHGVYKTDAELQMALEAGVGAIVLDNFEEIARLRQLAMGEVPVLVRIAPEVDADTHPLIRTGQRDSKFGFHLLNGDALRAVEQVLGDARFQLLGFHCHIGSQISDLDAFAAAAHAMVAFADMVRQRYGYTAPLLNLGGGLAARYTPDELDSLDPRLRRDAGRRAARRLPATRLSRACARCRAWSLADCRSGHHALPSRRGQACAPREPEPATRLSHRGWRRIR
jgi:diaminopimelate decarboxylase